MTLDQIKRIIEEHVPDCRAIVLDPYNDGEHLQALVISPEFEGKMLVKQHQMVMKPLKEAFATTVHALGLKTFTPSEWEKVRQDFGY
ncbi:MAG: BolA/IbaG family iron-sulfur metabolism protein [Candidatus Omnitrophica bacterium]|nr:BolA/IbaG family iron-sulfur metabolism protein [Candidatus Omnitrophota bacterium]